MSHELKMAIVDSIFQLRTLHWSARRIALHLDIDRGTVGKHLKRAKSGPKPAIPPAGSSTPPGAAKRSKNKPNVETGPDAGACQS